MASIFVFYQLSTDCEFFNNFSPLDSNNSVNFYVRVLSTDLAAVFL